MNRLRRIKRCIRLWIQRLTRGWDDSDTWQLDSVIAKFALPRLIRFKELHDGFPGGMTAEQWDSALDDMIYALRVCADWLEDGVDWQRVDRGLKLFGERFRELWW